MKCKILDCEKDAQGNFPCCSDSHGTTLRMRINNIKASFDADKEHDFHSRELYTIREVEYYTSL